MNWNNLRNNKCPDCGHMLEASTKFKGYMCADENCNFKVTEKRFSEIVKSLYFKHGWDKTEDQNLADLNSL